MFRPREVIIGLGLEHFKRHTQISLECYLYVPFKVFYSLPDGGIESSKHVAALIFYKKLCSMVICLVLCLRKILLFQCSVCK